MVDGILEALTGEVGSRPRSRRKSARREVLPPVSHLGFTKLLHINALVDGYDASLEHFRRLHGAQLLLEIPHRTSNACLVAIGGVLFELIAPKSSGSDRWRRVQAHGDHYIGVEYQVPDLARAKRESLERGLRLVVDGPVFFVTDPDDSFGVSFQVYEGDWLADPPPVPFIEPMMGSAYWQNEHPLGILGLKRYSVAVRDADAAARFFQRLSGSIVCYREERQALGTTAIGLQIGDTNVELLGPMRDGDIERHVRSLGQGIRAATFVVEDLSRVRSYFAARDFTLVAGDAPGTLALAPLHGRGLRFEYTE
jgi:hypothetical protein